MTLEPMPFMVINQAKTYMTGDEMALVQKAMHASETYHYKQKRKERVQGRRKAYFTHPTAVAGFLVDQGYDGTTVATGFLHDVVEDVDHVSLADIAASFGEDIATLVGQLTKVEHASGESCAACTHKQLQDIRAIRVKLADRYHNLQTLRHLPGLAKQADKVAETLTVYVPMARAHGEEGLADALEELAKRELARIEEEGDYYGQG